MRKAVTFGMETELLEQARCQARGENRTLTNIIETLLKRRIAEAAAGTSEHAEAERATESGTSVPRQPA